MARPLPKHRAREYETIFIVHPESSMDTVEQVAGKVTDVITKLEGKLLRAENWGKRRLAYPVKKQPQGVYLYLRYLGYSDIVHEIERNFRMIEPVLKYLTVKVEEDVDPAARPVNEANISFMPMFEEESVPERAAEAESDDAGAAKDAPADAADAAPAEAKSEEVKSEEVKSEEVKSEEAAKDGDAETSDESAAAAPAEEEKAVEEKVAEPAAEAPAEAAAAADEAEPAKAPEGDAEDAEKEE